MTERTYSEEEYDKKFEFISVDYNKPGMQRYLPWSSGKGSFAHFHVLKNHYQEICEGKIDSIPVAFVARYKPEVRNPRGICLKLTTDEAALESIVEQIKEDRGL
ncbi:hypothetical protein HY450_00740 [Candidatus Pacearchaeota archaeon]|nr:hypothetical protein [Candidatus Pacearchaeota archaeon]